MSSEFPRLQKKLDELRWEFEKKLQEVIKNNEELEDVELRISEANFIPRSPISRVAFSLRNRLDSCFDTKTGKIDLSKITEEHISLAQALMKIGRYQETAIHVLTEGLLLTGEDNHSKKIKKLASEALSECGSEIAMFDANNRNEAKELFDIVTMPNGEVCTRWTNSNGERSCYCPSGQLCNA